MRSPPRSEETTIPAYADTPPPPNPIKDVTDAPRTALPRR